MQDVSYSLQKSCLPIPYSIYSFTPLKNWLKGSFFYRNKPDRIVPWSSRLSSASSFSENARVPFNRHFWSKRNIDEILLNSALSFYPTSFCLFPIKIIVSFRKQTKIKMFL